MDTLRDQKVRLFIILSLILGFAYNVWSILKNEPSYVMLYFLLLLMGLLLSFLIAKEEENIRFFLVGIFVFSFLLRAAFALGLNIYLEEVTGSPYLPSGLNINPDDIKYDMGSQVVTDAWLKNAGIPSPDIIRDPHARLYYYLLGTLYYLFELGGGTTTFGIIIIHCFIGAFIPLYMVKLSYLLFNKKIAMSAGYISALLPNFLLYSSVIMRDMLISVIILFVVWEITAYVLKDQNLFRILVVIPIIGYVLPSLREGTVIAIAVISPLCLIVPALSLPLEKRKRVVRLIFFGSLVLIMVIPVFYRDWIYLAIRRLSFRSLTEQALIYQQRADPNSFAAQILLLQTWIRFPLLIVYTYVFPFPPWGGLISKPTLIQRVVNSLSGILWYILMPYSIAGLVHSIRENKFRFFPIFGTTIVFFVGYGLFAAFDARRRLMVMPLIIILVAVGWYNRFDYQKLVRWVGVIIFGTFVIYTYLKFLSGEGVFNVIGDVIWGQLIIWLILLTTLPKEKSSCTTS